MKIIYLCYEASFLPVVAANIHCKLLSTDKVPSTEELYQLPYYGKLFSHQQGRIIPIGIDTKGNQVYILGTRNGVNIVRRVIKGLLNIFSYNSNQVIFCDLRNVRNSLICLGLFFYCTLKIKVLGTFLITQGIKKIYSQLVKSLEI